MRQQPRKHESAFGVTEVACEKSASQDKPQKCREKLFIRNPEPWMLVMAWGTVPAYLVPYH